MEAQWHDPHPAVDGQSIRLALAANFGFSGISLEPAPRGFVAQTYYVSAVASSQANAVNRYFLKVFPNQRLAQNVAASAQVQVPLAQYLRSEYGYAVIPQPLATKAGSLVFTVDSITSEDHSCVRASPVTPLTAVMYERLPGTAVREYSWKQYFTVLCRIHRASQALAHLRCPELEEQFHVPEWHHWEILLDALTQGSGDSVEQRVVEYLEPRWQALHIHWQQWRDAANHCRAVPMLAYITHGDGPGNVMQLDAGLALVDWDDLLWAPWERDTWFHAFNPQQRDALVSTQRQYGLPVGFRPGFLHFYAAKRFFDDLLDFLEGIHKADAEATKQSLLAGMMQDCFGWTFPILESLHVDPA